MRRGGEAVQRKGCLGLVADRIQLGGGRIRRLATRGAHGGAPAPWELLPCERIQKGESREVGKGESGGVAGTCAHSRTQANGSGRRRGARRRRQLSLGGSRALKGWAVRCPKDRAHRLLVMGHHHHALDGIRPPPLQRAGASWWLQSIEILVSSSSLRLCFVCI
ncbi:hypothetical protein ACQJBY_054815 [Aegilops geniculata]